MNQLSNHHLPISNPWPSPCSLSFPPGINGSNFPTSLASLVLTSDGNGDGDVDGDDGTDKRLALNFC